MSNSETKTILVIDDDEDILFAITSILEIEKYRTLTAANGYQALELLKKEGLPDLILLDMKMPVMDGWKFAAEFNARHDHRAPIIIMTAAVDAKKRAQEVSAEAWLAKPFQINDVLTIVKRFISAP